MSRTYRRMKTERAIRAPRRSYVRISELGKSRESDQSTSREMSSMENFDF